MQVQKLGVNVQNFNGLQCHPNYGEVQYVIATKLSAKGFDKAMNMVDKLAKKKTYSSIYLAGDIENPKIYVEVGDKLFKEGFLTSCLRVVKKALKYSEKLDGMKKVM